MHATPETKLRENPYRSPVNIGSPSDEPRMVGFAPSPSLLLYAIAILPATIVFGRITVDLVRGIQGWGVLYWFFAIGPPLYLVCLWVATYRAADLDATPTSATSLRSVLPLVLHSTPIFFVMIDSFFRPGAYGSSNADVWIGVDLVCWALVSLIVVPGFGYLGWRRLTEPRPSQPYR